MTNRAEYNPVTTCSPAHNTLVESYGAVKAFDYHAVSCGVAIRAFTKGKLSHTRLHHLHG
jgi:aspyridone synthetase trans-acting enoyl reductase